MGTRRSARGSLPIETQTGFRRVRLDPSVPANCGDLDALRRRDAELVAEVAALRRERERAGDALRHDEKMAAVGLLTSGIAHDLGNLVAGIDSGLKLAQTRLAQERVADAGRVLGLAQDSVARACTLTRRLLAFARRQPLDPQPVEVAQLVTGMEGLIRSAVGPRVRIATALADGLWRALCDANQLEAVLLNLCINARDAMTRDGRLTIEARNVTVGEADAAARRGGAALGDYVALSVADTGTGMPPEVVARACDPFFTTKPAGQGTGLGLSQVRSFAEQVGGAVLIVSDPGRGTAVTVLLPRHAEGGAGGKPADAAAGGTVQAVKDGTWDAPADRGAAPNPRQGNERRNEPMTPPHPVLILDDDIELRCTLAGLLDGDGSFAASQAGSIGEARLMVRARRDAPFAALILDVDLPDGDGRDLCAELRRDGFEMPVLMLTGLNSEMDTVRGFEAGASDYVAKPFRIGELLARLRAQLRAFERSNAAVFTIGPYTFHPGAKLLQGPARNQRVRLTRKEAAVLKALYRAGGKPISQQALLDEVWGYSPAANSHTLETHIHSLRKKMEADLGGTRRLIATEGSGYRFDAAPAAAA